MDKKKLEDMGNGNYIKYSVKDLLAGVHQKLDKIDTRLADGDKKIARLETNVFWLKTAVMAIYGVIGSIIFKPIRKLIGGL